MNQPGNNWSKHTSKFAFAHNTSVNYTTGQTPYEIVFGTKPQVPMTLKLGLLRDKDKQCKSEFCDGLQSQTQSENSLPNNSFNRLLRPQLSDELLKRENEFKRIYSSTHQRSRQITSKAQEQRNRFELGRPISFGQKVFENHAQDLTRSQKLKQLRVGPFTVTKQITNTTYEIREEAIPTTSKLRIEITSSNTSRKKNDSLRSLLTMPSYPETPISISIWSTRKLNNITLVKKNTPLT